MQLKKTGWRVQRRTPRSAGMRYNRQQLLSFKVLLDAFQSILLTTGDDKDIETLVLKRYSCSRGAGEPLVKIFAYSRETELEEAFIKQAGVVSDDAIEEREEKPEDILT